MKACFVLLALVVLAARPELAVSATYSIYINDFSETASSCRIDNVSGIQTSTIGSANLVATTNPPSPLAFVNCGTGSGSSPVASLAISPVTVNASATSPGNQATLTWMANNVSGCTVTGSDPSVATEFPSQWLNATVVCTGTKCTGTPNTSTLTPIANGANGNYTFGLQCTNGTMTVSTTKVLAVTGSAATGGTPNANFSFSPNGLTVSFNDTSTDTPAGSTIGTWLWNFGEPSSGSNNTSTLQNPTHTYAGTGSYTVSLTVTDSVSSAQSSINKQVTVTTSNVTACTTGQAGDISGYTALCYGTAKFYNGGQGSTIGPSPFTFPFTFGSPWPGSYFGYTTVFTTTATQFVSIPFVASPAHSVQFITNSTYTPNNASVFSISTSPGLFNNMIANGSTVLCVGKNNPNLSVSSDGSTGMSCNVNTTGTYWLNMVPGNVVGGVFSGCAKSSCNIAVSQQLVH